MYIQYDRVLQSYELGKAKRRFRAAATLTSPNAIESTVIAKSLRVVALNSKLEFKVRNEMHLGGLSFEMQHSEWGT